MTKYGSGDRDDSGPDRLRKRVAYAVALGAVAAALASAPVVAQQVGAPQAVDAPEHRPGGEANLVLPDLEQTDVGGYNGRRLLMAGLVVSFAGILFGAGMLRQIRGLPVHAAMRQVSDLSTRPARHTSSRRGSSWRFSIPSSPS